MAVYRQVYTSFWQDQFILGLAPEEKFFYLYLMTNSKTTVCGIYELPLSIAVLETGFSRQKVETLLAKFQNEYKKIVFSKTTNEVLILNWKKYNDSKSPFFQTAVKSSLALVKDKSLIAIQDGVETVYTQSADSVETPNVYLSVSLPVIDSIPVLKDQYQDIIEKWNEVSGLAHIDCIEHKRKESVDARLKDKGIEKFLQMIENVKVSPFLLGEVKDRDGKNFKASFDWCIAPNNFQKVLDGNYIRGKADETLEEEVARRIKEMEKYAAAGGTK